MIDRAIDSLYSLAKFMVVVAGLYIIVTPPYELIGTISSAIMVIAAMVAIYAIWSRKPSVEFVALWFVATGIATYTGFVWTAFILDEASLARASVSTMALLLLAARGLHLWRLVKQISIIERRIEDHVD